VCRTVELAQNPADDVQIVADVVPEDAVDDRQSLFAPLDLSPRVGQAVHLLQHESRFRRPIRPRPELRRREVVRVLTERIPVDDLLVRPQHLGDGLVVEAVQVVLTQRRDREIGTRRVELGLESTTWW